MFLSHALADPILIVSRNSLLGFKAFGVPSCFSDICAARISDSLFSSCTLLLENDTFQSRRWVRGREVRGAVDGREVGKERVKHDELDDT